MTPFAEVAAGLVKWPAIIAGALAGLYGLIWWDRSRAEQRGMDKAEGEQHEAQQDAERRRQEARRRRWNLRKLREWLRRHAPD